MTFIIAILTTIALVHGAAAAEPTPAPECDVPESLIPVQNDLTRVGTEIKDRHRLDISVVGSGSSVLTGPDGARFAYPALLEEALRKRLPGNEIKVTLHVPTRQASTRSETSFAIATAGADVILMNMQFSPRTESMLGISAYADVMRWVTEQRGIALFDRLGIMHYWSDEGIFDLYSATNGYAMARRVHECIGRALASQIINAGHLDAEKIQTTR